MGKYRAAARPKDAVANASPAVSHCNSTETATTAAVHESDDNCVVCCSQRRSYLSAPLTLRRNGPRALHRVEDAPCGGGRLQNNKLWLSRGFSHCNGRTKIETAIANSASALPCRVMAQSSRESYDAWGGVCRVAKKPEGNRSKVHTIRLTLCIMQSGTFVVMTAVARLCSQSHVDNAFGQRHAAHMVRQARSCLRTRPKRTKQVPGLKADGFCRKPQMHMHTGASLGKGLACTNPSADRHSAHARTRVAHLFVARPGADHRHLSIVWQWKGAAPILAVFY